MRLRQTIALLCPLVLAATVAYADDVKVPAEKDGKPLTNEDGDADLAVSMTHTTSADPARRDVVESRAEEVREAQGHRWSAAPLLGYGTNDLNVGLGARVGYTFDTPVYVGGTFLYHFGTDNVAVGPGVTESQARVYYPATEVGYDVGLGPVLLRPYGGVGVLFRQTSVTTNGLQASNTNTSLTVYPGVTAEYLLPRTPVFVGGDARVLLPLENESTSLSVFATTGVKL